MDKTKRAKIKRCYSKEYRALRRLFVHRYWQVHSSGGGGIIENDKWIMAILNSKALRIVHKKNEN